MRTLVIVALSVLVLAACSRTEFFYRNADWFAYRWVDGLLDAEGQQDERWSAQLEAVMQRHREELLGDVVVWLDATSHRIDGRLSDVELRCLWDNGEDVLAAHAALFVDPAVAILSNVSPRQVDHLASELDERDAEYRERYLQPDRHERLEARIERFTERIERWTGKLDNAQRRLVADAVTQMPDLAVDWFGYRKAQQQQLLALLREPASQDSLRGFLAGWWVGQHGRSETLLQGYQDLKEGWIAMLVALDPTFSEAQREHLQARVDDLRDDLAGELADGDGRLTRVAHPGGQLPCAQSL